MVVKINLVIGYSKMHFEARSCASRGLRGVLFPEAVAPMRYVCATVLAGTSSPSVRARWTLCEDTDAGKIRPAGAKSCPNHCSAR
jgi:hypothetical protein